MGVAVDETGHEDHAGAVDDLGGGLLGGDFGDVDDLAVLHAHMTAEEHIVALVHGHNSDVGNQSIQI